MGAYGIRLRRAPVDRIAVGVGDEVLFTGDRAPFTARAVSADGRWVICTRPINDDDRAREDEDGERWITSTGATVIYTIIDFHAGVRGADNYGGLGYETPEEIADALEWLVDGRAEVSVRYDVHLDIAAVRPRGVAWCPGCEQEAGTDRIHSHGATFCGTCAARLTAHPTGGEVSDQ